MAYFIVEADVPKYKPSTEKAKAGKAIKSYIESGLNQSEMARREGTSQPTVNRKIHRKPVQDLLSKFLKSPKLKKALVEVAKDGLLATKIQGATILVAKDGSVIKAEDTGGIEIKDYNARHKFWHDLMTSAGKLKNNNSAQIFNIIITQSQLEEKVADINTARAEGLI